MRVMLPLLRGRDTIIQASSSSGKTAAVLIAALHLIDTGIRSCQVLILVPTRELASVTRRRLAALGERLPVRHHALFGGVPVRDDIAAIGEGVHAVVGTPGRVSDLVQKRLLRLGALKLLVFDEVDHLLDRGFGDQISEIMQCGELPKSVQVVLVSATSPVEFVDLAVKVVRDPAVFVGKVAFRAAKLAFLSRATPCVPLSSKL